jgi:SAM-dependent methyltransferase
MIKQSGNTSSVCRCTLCGEANYHPLLTKENDGRGDGPLFLYRCSQCGVVYLESGNEGYDLNLYSYYKERNLRQKSDLYSSINEVRFVELLKWLSRRNPGKKILDVGCGQGHFVDVASRLGFEVLGIEVSDSAVSVCQSFSLPVIHGDIFTASVTA